MDNELWALGVMVGDPRPESVGEHLQQFIVVLAGAAALPHRLTRRHFTYDSVIPHSLSAVAAQAGAFRIPHLTKDLRRSPPTRHAVFPEKRGVPGRIRVADLEVRNPVQGRRGNVCLQPDLQRLEAQALVEFFRKILERLG